MRRVILESPYRGEVQFNLTYARACVRDCLNRGESCYASHLLYTQPGILRDELEEERQQGIEAGFAWWEAADALVFYIDLGWSPGMVAARIRALQLGYMFEERTLGKAALLGLSM